MTAPQSDEPAAAAYDCCVVGAGPVGLAFAMEAAEAGARVLLIDAGDVTSGKRDVVRSDVQRTEIVDTARHAPIELITRWGIGGTSWLWGGRCVAFEPIDFTARRCSAQRLAHQRGRTSLRGTPRPPGTWTAGPRSSDPRIRIGTASRSSPCRTSNGGPGQPKLAPASAPGFSRTPGDGGARHSRLGGPRVRR